MKAIKYLLVITTLALPSALFAAETFISHYESLHGVAMHEAGYAGTESNQGAAAPVTLSFEALGRRFDLDLEVNDRVLDALPADAAYNGISVYRGRLVNNPDSWVRIVIFEGMPRGLVWDGETMFAIEAPGDSAADITEPVMFRLSDLNIAPGTMTCGAIPMGGNAAQYLTSVKGELETIAQAPGATSEITMSVIADSSFTAARGGDAAAVAAITARFNNIDGYFSQQVGVQLDVDLIETHDAASDPFDPATFDPTDLLTELSEYRLQNPTHSSRGLTHLYTGRDVTGTTVGLAWLGTTCSDYFGAGLSEGRAGLITDSLIAAHEIGHNFNADHDGEAGRSCPDTPEDFIMAPSVNLNQQFSDCSINRMQAHAARARCVAALPAVDVSIEMTDPTSNVLLGANTVIEYEVSINGTLGVSGVVADFTLPTVLSLDSVAASSGNCDSGAGTASCTFGDLPRLSTHTVTLTTTPGAVGTGTLSASVSTTDADERPVNNQDSLQLTVDPAVDLVVNGPSTTPVFVNNSTTVTATLENRSILTATNVILSVALDNGLRADTASWSIGTCTVAARQIDCTASNFAAQSSSALTITATGVSTGMQDVSISLASAEADANPSNNNASRAVNVVTPQDESDDDGGGSTGPLLLLLLAVAAGCRLRRGRHSFGPVS